MPLPLAFYGCFSSRQVGERLFPRNSSLKHTAVTPPFQPTALRVPQEVFLVPT